MTVNVSFRQVTRRERAIRRNAALCAAYAFQPGGDIAEMEGLHGMYREEQNLLLRIDYFIRDYGYNPLIPLNVNREEWLASVISGLRPRFRRKGLPLPRKIKASCGWPSSKQLHGECWAAHTSKAGVVEIFISPACDNEVQVASILVHELLHARQKSPDHGAVWKQEATSIGLLFGDHVWKTYPNPKLKEALVRLLNELPPYPHVKIRA